MADNNTPYILTAVASVWATWATFFKDREKTRADARAQQQNHVIHAFEQFQNIEDRIREDFALQMLEMKSDQKILETKLDEAEDKIRDQDGKIRDLGAKLEASQKEVQQERELRVQAEGLYQKAEGQIDELNGHRLKSDKRIEELEATMKQHGIALNGSLHIGTEDTNEHR